MLVRDCMSGRVVTVTADTPVSKVQTVMRNRHIHRLPVVDEKKKLIGLLTERRLSVMMASMGARTAAMRGEPLAAIKVGDVMATHVITVPPNVLLSQAVSLLHKHHIGCLPVVEDKGQMVGIITTSDLVRISYYSINPEKQGAYIYIGGGIRQDKLMDILSIIHKHGAKIRMLLQVKTRDIVIHIDVDDVTPIKEEIAARKYLCSITSYSA